jgi:hypothetical protein
VVSALVLCHDARIVDCGVVICCTRVCVPMPFGEKKSCPLPSPMKGHIASHAWGDGTKRPFFLRSREKQQ